MIILDTNTMYRIAGIENDEKLDKLILAIGNLTKVVEGKRLIVDEQSIVNTANNGLGRKYKEKSYIRGGL